MTPIEKKSRTRETRASRGARGVTRRAGVAVADRAPIAPASDPPALTPECARAPRGTPRAHRSALPMAPTIPAEEKSRTREIRASRGARGVTCRAGVSIAACTPISPASYPPALTPECARAPRGTPSAARTALPMAPIEEKSRTREIRASRGARGVTRRAGVALADRASIPPASYPPALTPECARAPRGTPSIVGKTSPKATFSDLLDHAGFVKSKSIAASIPIWSSLSRPRSCCFR